MLTSNWQSLVQRVAIKGRANRIGVANLVIMPNLYCTLPDRDFSSYSAIQETIAVCTVQAVREQILDGHIIIVVSFITDTEKKLFLEKVTTLPLPVTWRDNE